MVATSYCKATSLGFPQFGPLLESLASISPNYFDEFRTTGYSDYDMFGDDTYNTKGNFAIHFRPNENSEFSLQSLVGTGNTVLSTGGTRYHLKDFKIQQHKLDYKSGGLSARYYYTKEDAGTTNISGLMALGLQAKQPGGALGNGSNTLPQYLFRWSSARSWSSCRVYGSCWAVTKCCWSYTRTSRSRS